MGDFYGVCALLAALMFFVLIQKFDKKFGKVEKELDEIKKRMVHFSQSSGENSFRSCTIEGKCIG